MGVDSAGDPDVVDTSRQPGSMPFLEQIRGRIERLTPQQALAEQESGALIVDVRTDVHRDGAANIPGSLAIDLTVLPWRLDPFFDWRIPEADSLDRRWILVCRHGFSSSLAAWNLQQMGLTRVAEIEGGFQAWEEAGLPVTWEPPDRRQ